MLFARPSIVAGSLARDDAHGRFVYAEVFAAFAAIAWYNAIELIVLCFISFKRRRSCYFWSLLISSASIVPLYVGYFLFLFRIATSPYMSVTLITFGWTGMVTGQSVVLWSRLHLVLQNTKVLSGLLWMIIIDAILFHVPTTVLFYGTVAEPTSNFARGYDIMERIELLGFCIQELIISSIYVWETVKLLRLRPSGRRNSILRQLLFINIAILIIDVAIVIIEYAGLYAIQVMFKPAAYSVKLKLEYAILGRLVLVARRGVHQGNNLISGSHEINWFSTSEPPSHSESQHTVHRQYSSPRGPEASNRSFISSRT